MVVTRGRGGTPDRSGCTAQLLQCDVLGRCFSLFSCLSSVSGGPHRAVRVEGAAQAPEINFPALVLFENTETILPGMI